ncbi:MAG: hypothetical protein Q9191_001603 [Dirinaria sp. TL-2023a]
MGEMSASTLAHGINTSRGTIRCHRGRLEHFLQEGQNIRWKHAVDGVQILSQRRVVVHLKDKQLMETEVLIGTDGVHSQVRKSLLPSVELKVHPFVVFNGKRRVPIAEFNATIAPALRDRMITHFHRGEIILEMSINEFTPEQVDISFTYSRPARNNDPLHKPDRPIPGATSIPEDFNIELEELKQLDQPFDTIFKAQAVRKDRVLHWLMRSALVNRDEVKGLADQGVLLVGDAVHAMPILGGEGANNAMKDGVNLAQYIAHHGVDNLRAFTDTRYGAWKNGVEESDKRLVDMHGRRQASLWSAACCGAPRVAYWPFN